MPYKFTFDLSKIPRFVFKEIAKTSYRRGMHKQVAKTAREMTRKFMDGRCKATFDSNIPSYICAHCSTDCLVENATTFAQKKGYDVYVLPGGSCIPKILKAKNYEGIVGVAGGRE